MGQVGGAVGFNRASIIHVKSCSHWLAMTLTQSISIFLGSDGPDASEGFKSRFTTVCVLHSYREKTIASVNKLHVNYRLTIFHIED